MIWSACEAVGTSALRWCGTEVRGTNNKGRVWGGVIGWDMNLWRVKLGTASPLGGNDWVW